jgi:hypothetical protein
MLEHIWPIELNSFCIVIIRGSLTKPQFERFWPAYCQPADYQTSSQPPQNLPPLRVHLRLHNNHFTLLLPEVGSPLDQLIQDLADAYDDLSAYPSVIDHYAQLPIDSLSETDWSVSNTIIQLLQNEPGDATSPSASQQNSSDELPASSHIGAVDLLSDTSSAPSQPQSLLSALAAVPVTANRRHARNRSRKKQSAARTAATLAVSQLVHSVSS